jgi:hypothetical protein
MYKINTRVVGKEKKTAQAADQQQQQKMRRQIIEQHVFYYLERTFLYPNMLFSRALFAVIKDC